MTKEPGGLNREMAKFYGDAAMILEKAGVAMVRTEGLLMRAEQILVELKSMEARCKVCWLTKMDELKKSQQALEALHADMHEHWDRGIDQMARELEGDTHFNLMLDEIEEPVFDVNARDP